MFRKTDFQILALAVVCAVFPVSYVAAQETQDSTSVAEAAKRARQQKQSAAKPSKVVTNDTLAPAAATANGAATPNPATSSANAATENSSAPASGAQPAASPQDDEKAKAEIDALKRMIKEKQQAADLLQRELSLEQDNFYRKQDYQRDSAGKQKLDTMQSDVQQMLDELVALKAKLTDLAGPDALKEAPKTPTAPNAPETPAPPAQPQP